MHFSTFFYNTVATNNPKENLPDGSSSQYPDETEIKTCETGQEKLTRFRMATPPPDWEFRQILVKIAREMNKSDLKLAIAMFRGRSCRILSN